MSVQDRPQYTTLKDLVNDIQDIMNVYRSNVLESIEKSIDTCGDIFIAEAKKVSPVDTGEYQNSWAKKKKSRQKYSVYIGNTKKVMRKNKEGKREKKLPLINVLEFSKEHGKPHVGKAVANSKDQIINTIAAGIEKESK